MKNSLEEMPLRAAFSMPSGSALRKISSESRSLINLPTMVLCLGTETLLLLARRILSLSHGSKLKGINLPASLLAKTVCLPSPDTHCVQAFSVLLCLISLVKGGNKTKKKKRAKQNKRKELGTLLRTRKEKPEEVEAFDAI